MKPTLLILLGLLAGCSDESGDTVKNKVLPKSALTEQPKEQTNTYPTVEVSGTVVWKNFEGGFWGFDSDDGKKFMPQNLPKAYRQDGTKLKLTGLVITDMMTFQQYGQPLKIKDVVLIEKSTKGQADEY